MTQILLSRYGVLVARVCAILIVKFCKVLFVLLAVAPIDLIRQLCLAVVPNLLFY